MRAELVNLLRRWPGDQGKGDAFPIARARRAAGKFKPAGVVLLAGKRVAEAFGERRAYFEWFDLRGARAAVIPHPSGISHWWNEPANVARAAAFMRRALA